MPHECTRTTTWSGPGRGHRPLLDGDDAGRLVDGRRHDLGQRAPDAEPDMGVRLRARSPARRARRPGGAGRPGSLPGQGEVAECRVEAAGRPVLDAPGQGEPAVGHPPPGDREVDLVLGQAEQDPGVGAQVARRGRPRRARPTAGRGEPSPGGPRRPRRWRSPGSRDDRRSGPRAWCRTRATCGWRRWPSARREGAASRRATTNAIAAFCSGDQGVSPMVKRASTRAAAETSGETSRTSVTAIGFRPAMSASWDSAVVAWPNVPCTPAGQST